MKMASGWISIGLSLMLVSFCHAQPVTSSAQSAKEQRQASNVKDKARPDRSQAEARKLKGAQKEAGERYDQKMTGANNDLTMGIASGAPQAASSAGAKKKAEKFDLHKKDAIKKSVQ